MNKASLFPSFDEMESLAKSNHQATKIYDNKIDEILLEEIQKNPYFKITEMVNNHGGQIANMLISLSHNT